MELKRILGWFLVGLGLIAHVQEVQAQSSLQVIDLELKHQPSLVATTPWQGRTVIMVMVPDAGKKQTLRLVGLQGKALQELVRFPLPDDIRWLEPLAMGKGKSGWLALVGATWMVGTGEKTLQWHPLCDCPTLFSIGEHRLPSQAGFANDLDGDGRSEILLPDWNGLNVYSLDFSSGGGAKLQPVIRIHWKISEHYESREDKISVTLNLPRYQLKDANRDGVLDFVSLSDSGISVAMLPKPVPASRGPYYAIFPGRLSALRQAGLPAPVIAGLRSLGAQSFSGSAALLSALEKAMGAKGKNQLTGARVATLLQLLKEHTPVSFPQFAGVDQARIDNRKESHKVHTVAEMNGDGVLDLIHLKSTDTGGLLGQKNHLRWIPGRVEKGQLSFKGQSPQVLFSEGPVFAELIYPATDPKAPPAVFLATTEVNLLAVVRAFTLSTVVLNLFVYPFEDGKLVKPPPVQGDLTFELKKKDKKNRPMILLADLDGDGWREYLFNMETDSLTAFRGSPTGPNLRGNPMASRQVALPGRPRTIFVNDLDGDGREELTLWFNRQENPEALLRTLRVVRYQPGAAQP